ncbi:hypothetical protein U8527_06935 [Kordia algicida OT-1]|uniref:Uncharacterized protein n=1 Tax=Kordia algicida OT-1 TaxID=391587 RepID=A9E9I5_9FLAO|nr:hypothetical protein [Kordia algicida]EDP94675.1 hypothetical protein KAOT1_00325 [Kordia algicida OT-1]
MKKSIFIISGAGVGILLIGSFIIRDRTKKQERLTSKLLIALSARIEPIKNGLGGQNAFDIHYLDKVTQRVSGSVIALQESTALYYANQIKSAFGAWYQGGDDEQKVYSVFRKLKDKVQVSQVAKAFQGGDESVNLIDVLKDRFDKNEIKIVLDIVNKKPNYRTT